MWHVSLSYWIDRESSRVSTLDPVRRERLHREALRQLEDVGDQALERWDAGEAAHVVHFRRALKRSEELLLPSPFLSCSAVDVAGPVKPIDLLAA